MRIFRVPRHILARRAILLGSMFLACTLAPAMARASGTAIEYFNVALGHYFLTAFPEEAAALDAGTIAGWSRTGLSFPVETVATGGAQPVCRFFSAAFAPKSGHFYTPYAGECAAVKGDPVWSYEAIAFYLALPDAAGACAAGATPIYRLYNNGTTGAPNHRYTSSLGIFNLMKAQGWTPEGDGNTGVFACGPASAVSAGGVTGAFAFNPQVRFLSTADGAAIVEQTELRIVFARAVPIAVDDVFMVPENGVFRAETISMLDGRMIVTVLAPTLDEVFAQLDVEGNVPLAVPGLPPAAAAAWTTREAKVDNATGAKSTKSFTFQQRAFTTVENGVPGIRYEFNIATDCGAASNGKMKLAEISLGVFGPVYIKVNKNSGDQAVVKFARVAPRIAGYTGCRLSLPLGQVKLLDLPFPIAGLPGLVVRVPVFLGSRLETDMTPIVSLADAEVDIFLTREPGVNPQISPPRGKVLSKEALASALPLTAGASYSARFGVELDVSARVIVGGLFGLGGMHIASVGTKTGPALDFIAKVGTSGFEICATLIQPTSVYYQYRRGRKLESGTAFEASFALATVAGACAAAPPTGQWRFVNDTCSTVPVGCAVCNSPLTLDLAMSADNGILDFRVADTPFIAARLEKIPGVLRGYGGCFNAAESTTFQPNCSAGSQSITFDATFKSSRLDSFITFPDGCQVYWSGSGALQ